MDEIAAEEVRDWIVALLPPCYTAAIQRDKRSGDQRDDVTQACEGHDEQLPMRAADNVASHLRNGVLLSLLLQRLAHDENQQQQQQHQHCVKDAHDESAATDASASSSPVFHVPRRCDGFYARDHVADFLRTLAVRYGLHEGQLFSGSDLCDGQNSRRVITALLNLARVVHRRHPHVPVPALVRYESEIGARGVRWGTEEMNDRAIGEMESDKMSGAGGVTDGMHDKESKSQDRCVTESTACDVEANTCLGAGDESSHGNAEAEEEANAAPPDACTTPPTERESPARSVTSSDAEDRQTECLRKSTDRVEVNQNTAEVQQNDAQVNENNAAEVCQNNAARRSRIKRPCCTESSRTTPTKVPLRHPHDVVRSAAPRYVSQHGDGIDVAVGEVLNTHYRDHRQSPWRARALRSHAGEYVLYHRLNSQRILLHARVIQGRVLVCGGVNAHRTQKWVDLRTVLEQIDLA